MAVRASGHNRTTDLAFRYTGKITPEEPPRQRALVGCLASTGDAESALEHEEVEQRSEPTA